MKRAKRSRRSRLGLLESLEPRVLLSGVVSTSYSVGNLAITCDDNPNNITIVKTPGTNTVQITANDGETFTGFGSSIANVTGHIRLVGAGGADTITFGQDGQTFRVGDMASPEAWPTNLKDLTIDLGTGADTLTIIAVTARNIPITGGSGANAITLRDNGDGDRITDSTRAFGDLTVTQGGDGGDVTIRGTLVYKGAVITMGNGGGSATIDWDTTYNYTTWIGRNLTITGGLLGETVNLWALNAEGSVTVNLAGSLGATPNMLDIYIVEASGNFTYTGGTWADEVGGEEAYLTAGGSILLDLKEGDNRVDFDGWSYFAAGRNFTYTGGAGTDDLDLGELDAGGNATFTLGAGTNTLEVRGWNDVVCDITGNLTITAAAGTDAVTFMESDGGYVGGSVSINLAAGTNSLRFDDLDDPFQVGGNFTYTGGAGVDMLTWDEVALQVAGNVTLNLGEGANTLAMSSPALAPILGGNLLSNDNGDGFIPTIIGGNLSVTGGATSDTVTFGPGEFLVVGNVTINLKGGTNTVAFGEAPPPIQEGAGVSFEDGYTEFQVYGALTYTGGAAEDHFLQSGDLGVGGNLSINAQGGDNEIWLVNGSGFLEVVGNLTYTGGNAEDDLEACWGPVAVGGSVAFNVAGGPNHLHLHELMSGANITYTGGGDTDDLDLYGLWAAMGSVTITLGAGANTIEWGQSEGGLMDIVKNLTITAGAAADAIAFGAWDSSAGFVGGNVSINLGAGANSLLFTDESLDLQGASAATLIDESSATLLVGGSFTYTGTSGDDDLEWDEFPIEVRRNMTLNLGEGQNAVSMDSGFEFLKEPEFLENLAGFDGDGEGTSIYGSLTINGSTADDELDFYGFFLVGASAVFNLKGGTNDTYFEAEFDIYGSLSYIGGNGTDLWEQWGFLGVGGNAVFDPKGGTNEFHAEDGYFDVTGALTYAGGAGTDDWSGGWSLSVGGNMAVNLGEGADQAADLGYCFSCGGNLSVTGGAGADAVIFGDESDVQGSVTLTLKEGANYVGVDSYLDIVGALGITSGSGDDLLNLRGLSVLGSTTINTGHGANEIAIYNSASLRALSLATGLGADKVWLGNDRDDSGGWDPSEFKDSVAVDLGAGDDRLYTGFTTGDGFAAEFYGLVGFNGGAGLDDQYTFQDTYFAFAPTLANWEVP